MMIQREITQLQIMMSMVRWFVRRPCPAYYEQWTMPLLYNQKHNNRKSMKSTWNQITICYYSYVHLDCMDGAPWIKMYSVTQQVRDAEVLLVQFSLYVQFSLKPHSFIPDRQRSGHKRDRTDQMPDVRTAELNMLLSHFFNLFCHLIDMSCGWRYFCGQLT